MFTSYNRTTAGRRLPASMAYQAVHIESQIGGDSTPHRLVSMLFDGLMESIAQAKGAILTQQLDPKLKAITRAINIVEEGLRGNLDMKAGGKLSADLHDLYGYVSARLMHANVHNDAEALDECVRLIQPIKDAWNQIAPAAQIHS